MDRRRHYPNHARAPPETKISYGAIGRRAKNDRLDAQLIAHYGDAIKPEVTIIQAASLIGVAPVTKENGRYKGKRVIQGGRAQVRTMLYMAMMSAMQCNPVFKATYTRLVAAGKPKKVAIIACVRKMVVILNSMLRDGVMWDENLAKI